MCCLGFQEKKEGTRVGVGMASADVWHAGRGSEGWVVVQRGQHGWSYQDLEERHG